MSETTRAQAIASQVMQLEDTEVLVLRLPEGLATTDSAFQNFAAELRAILADGRTEENPARVVVLGPGMEIELLTSEQLARLGLRATAKHPYKNPELLFTSGPLREAARAGWESANGQADSADVCADTARRSLEAEIVSAKKLDISTS